MSDHGWEGIDEGGGGGAACDLVGSYRIEAGVTNAACHIYPTIAACLLAVPDDGSPLVLELAPASVAYAWADGVGLAAGSARSVTIWSPRQDTQIELSGTFEAADASQPILQLQGMLVSQTANVVLGANRAIEITNGAQYDGNNFTCTTEESFGVVSNAQLRQVRFVGVPGTFNSWSLQQTYVFNNLANRPFTTCGELVAAGSQFNHTGTGIFTADTTADIFCESCSFYTDAGAANLTLFDAGAGGTVALWGCEKTDVVTTGSVAVKNATATIDGAIRLLADYVHVALVDKAGDDQAASIGGVPWRTAAPALAALVALATTGVKHGALHFGPGRWDEDIAAKFLTEFHLGITGSGRTHVTNLRSLKFTPATAGNSLNVSISDLSLGSIVAATQGANPPLRFADDGGAGNIFATIRHCYLLSETNGTTVLQNDYTTGTGTISISLLDGVQISHPGATSVKAIVSGRGRIFGGSNFEAGSDNFPAVTLTGAATFTLNDGACNVDGGATADIDAISHTGTGGITLANASVTPKGNGHGVKVTGVGQTTSIGDSAIIQGAAATGDLVNNALGAAAIGRNTKITPTGAGIPTITAAAVVALPGLAVSQNVTVPVSAALQTVPKGVLKRTVHVGLSLTATGVNAASWTIAVETGVGTGVYDTIFDPTTPIGLLSAIPVGYSFPVAGGRRYKFTKGGLAGTTETITRYSYTDEG